jgi:hypothetical protein
MYPVAMLLLCAMTAVTVLMVLQNTLELLIGIKALPLSTRVSQLLLNLQYALLLFLFTICTAVRKMVPDSLSLLCDKSSKNLQHILKLNVNIVTFRSFDVSTLLPSP